MNAFSPKYEKLIHLKHGHLLVYKMQDKDFPVSETSHSKQLLKDLTEMLTAALLQLKLSIFLEIKGSSMFLNLKLSTLFSSLIVMQMVILIFLNSFKSFCHAKTTCSETLQLIDHLSMLEKMNICQETLNMLLQLSLKKKSISKEESSH